MKKKVFNKKLVLNKETVANLSDIQMNKINGGNNGCKSGTIHLCSGNPCQVTATNCKLCPGNTQGMCW